MAIVAGVDFGTLSVRVSIVDSERGILASAISEYPLHRKREDPEFATQSHEDHMRALADATRKAVTAAGISGDQVQSIALDTTGYSVVPVDDQMRPLNEYYLWCDHRAKKEAAEITELAHREKLEAIDWCGGVYSSEWGFSKLLHWLRHNAEKREKFASAFEQGDVVNVVGTSTCIIAYAPKAQLVPGVCGVVPGSVHPQYTGIEAGLSATGDIFSAIARRANTTVESLSKGLENYHAGQTGLLRMTWDNGDRTVLVNPNLGGMTLGWNLQHTAQDELFAAIEGTAFHTRVILDRMSEHGAPTRRVINGGGIPQNNPVLNQVYANVLGRPVLVPSSKVTGLGSAIFAFMAAGVFSSIDEAQQHVCPSHTIYEPQPDAESAYRELYELYRKGYFELGSPQGRSGFGHLLPTLMRIARHA